MSRLLVLSVLLAAAAAEPSVFYSEPLAPVVYSAPIATYVQQTSYLPSAAYSGITYPHLIKKRSPQSEGYASKAVQSTSKYSAPPPSTPKEAPVQTTYASSEHYTQKRSAPFFAPTSYIAPAPLASAYVSSSPIDLYSAIPSPYFSAYTGYTGLPLIKK